MNPSTIYFSASKLNSHSSPASFTEGPASAHIIRDRKFLYTLIHEIRNPLTNINLAIEILNQTMNDEHQKKYLDIAIRNSARIKDMVANLLISQRINGRNRKKQSAHSLLEEILITNQDRFALKNVAVIKNYTTRDFNMPFNRSNVKIALTNIIINAIEAMPEKDGLLEITTKLWQGICTIIIKDNGTGISKENLKNIFRPYFTNKPGGIGLGLSGTLSILRSNHIWVNVRSEVGKGTRFILSFKNRSI